MAKTSPSKRVHTAGWRLKPRGWALWPLIFALGACAPLDEGDADLARIRRLPDPVEFGARIHPDLIAGCAAAACHGQERSFSLHDVDPLPIDAQLGHPLDLPEALAADYYMVLSLCDLQIPEASSLIRWGTGAEAAHPGQAAMGPDLEAALLNWLRSGGTP